MIMRYPGPGRIATLAWQTPAAAASDVRVGGALGDEMFLGGFGYPSRAGFFAIALRGAKSAEHLFFRSIRQCIHFTGHAPW